jgi:hypothetical protein
MTYEILVTFFFDRIPVTCDVNQGKNQGKKSNKGKKKTGLFEK